MRENHQITRRYQRYQTDCRVRVRVYLDEYLVSTMDGRCRELARGGMGAQLPDQLRIGECVQVELGRAATAYATVRYVNGFYHGLEFTLVRENGRRYIDQLCDGFAREQEAAAAAAPN